MSPLACAVRRRFCTVSRKTCVKWEDMGSSPQDPRCSWLTGTIKVSRFKKKNSVTYPFRPSCLVVRKSYMENILALKVSCRSINNCCGLKGCVSITIRLQLFTTGFEQKWSNLTLREIQVAIGGINVDISLRKTQKEIIGTSYTVL